MFYLYIQSSVLFSISYQTPILLCFILWNSHFSINPVVSYKPEPPQSNFSNKRHTIFQTIKRGLRNHSAVANIQISTDHFLFSSHKRGSPRASFISMPWNWANIFLDQQQMRQVSLAVFWLGVLWLTYRRDDQVA